jgi:isochorismate pyruvate lyase
MIVLGVRILGAAALIGAGAALAVEADPPAYWGHPAANGGKCCASLKDVRANIDRIDHEIVAAMAERGQYVAEAGRFKKDPAAVSDPARVEAIVARVRAMAQADGLEPAVADKTYRAMIAAFEDFERAEWGKRPPGKP